MTTMEFAPGAWMPIAELAVEHKVPVSRLYHAGERGELTLRREGPRWVAQAWEVAAFAARQAVPA